MKQAFESSSMKNFFSNPMSPFITIIVGCLSAPLFLINGWLMILSVFLVVFSTVWLIYLGLFNNTSQEHNLLRHKIKYVIGGAMLILDSIMFCVYENTVYHIDANVEFLPYLMWPLFVAGLLQICMSCISVGNISKETESVKANQVRSAIYDFALGKIDLPEKNQRNYKEQ